MSDDARMQVEAGIERRWVMQVVQHLACVFLAADVRGHRCRGTDGDSRGGKGGRAGCGVVEGVFVCLSLSLLMGGWLS